MQQQQQPLAEVGDGPAAGVPGWGLCRTGAGGTGLGQSFEGNGAVFLFWVKCFGSDSLECLPAQAQCGEQGGRMLLVPEQGWGKAAGKGNFAATFLFISFVLTPEESRSFCVRADNALQV